jgi:hypothetical protein
MISHRVGPFLFFLPLIAWTFLLSSCASHFAKPTKEFRRAPTATEEIDPTFGGEFTFKPKNLADEATYRGQKKDVQKFLQKLAEKNAGRNPHDADYLVIDKRNLKITYPNLNGFFLKLHADPDVIEVTHQPVKLEVLEKVAGTVQKDLFEGLAELGLVPHSYEGSGHMHLSSKELQTDSALLRNFIVDTVNYWELASGVLGDNRTDGYGPALNYSKFDKSEGGKYYDYPIVDGSEVVTYKGALDLHDRLIVWDDAVDRIDREFAHNLNPTMDEVKDVLSDGLGRSRYFEINVLTGFDRAAEAITNGVTEELRLLRPQKSFFEYLALARLFKGRLNYLSGLNFLVPVRRDFPSVTKVEPIRGAQAFRNYVEDAGLKWELYKPLLVGPYRKVRPVSYPQADENRTVVRQCTGSSCGLAAVSNALEVWDPGFHADQRKILDHLIQNRWKNKLEDNGNGLTGEELSSMSLELFTALGIQGAKTSYFRFPENKTPVGSPPTRATDDEFRSVLDIALRGGARKHLVVEINPEILWNNARVQVRPGGTGHFVYVQGYQSSTDRVLIEDSYPDSPSTYWVSTLELMKAINTSDDDLKGKRKGVLLISLPEERISPGVKNTNGLAQPFGGMCADVLLTK